MTDVIQIDLTHVDLFHRREEQLADDNQLLTGDKYTTPATAESGYRSQLTIPSTGKENITPQQSADKTNLSSMLLRANDSKNLREEARKVQQSELNSNRVCLYSYML